MPFSRAVDLDPHESTFIFPPPFHFMTCLNVEFYGEKDECVKVASILKFIPNNLRIFIQNDSRIFLPDFTQISNKHLHG